MTKARMFAFPMSSNVNETGDPFLQYDKLMFGWFLGRIVVTREQTKDMAYTPAKTRLGAVGGKKSIIFSMLTYRTLFCFCL